jgi:hypothetical protein
MSLVDKIRSANSDYYDESFRSHVRAHFPLMKQDKRIIRMTPTDHEKIVYRGDLQAYLLSKRVSPSLHWYVMAISGLLSFYDLNESTSTLLVPTSEMIEPYRATWNTQTKSAY